MWQPEGQRRNEVDLKMAHDTLERTAADTLLKASATLHGAPTRNCSCAGSTC